MNTKSRKPPDSNYSPPTGGGRGGHLLQLSVGNDPEEHGHNNRNRMGHFLIHPTPAPPLKGRGVVECLSSENKSLVLSDKSLVFYNKNLVFYNKSLVFYNKSLVFYNRSIVFYNKSLVFYNKSLVFSKNRLLFFNRSLLFAMSHTTTVRLLQMERDSDKETAAFSVGGVE